jgi:hypothetical protein
VTGVAASTALNVQWTPYSTKPNWVSGCYATVDAQLDAKRSSSKAFTLGKTESGVEYGDAACKQPLTCGRKYLVRARTDREVLGGWSKAVDCSTKPCKCPKKPCAPKLDPPMLSGYCSTLKSDTNYESSFVAGARGAPNGVLVTVFINSQRHCSFLYDAPVPAGNYVTFRIGAVAPSSKRIVKSSCNGGKLPCGPITIRVRHLKLLQCFDGLTCKHTCTSRCQHRLPFANIDYHLLTFVFLPTIIHTHTSLHVR